MKKSEIKQLPAMGLIKKVVLSAIVLGLGTTTALAAQTTGGNFTMINPAPAVVDGTNDIVFTWDGTLNTDVATASVNAYMISALPQPFFSFTWTAYSIKVYGPGTYTIPTADTWGGSDPDCPYTTGSYSNPLGCDSTVRYYNVTVNPGEIMAHMKFAWNGAQGIDVINVWKLNTIFAPNSMWTGAAGAGNSATVWSLMSGDWNGDGINGGGMIDGPFQGYNANFNVMLNTNPSSFAFTNQSNVTASTLTESDAITVTGTDGTQTEVYVLSVSNGQYSINGGAYTSTIGTVIEGQTVKVRNTSSGTACGQVTTDLNIGGSSSSFTTTTTGVGCTDTTPNQFLFTDQTNVAVSTAIVSNSITVRGIDGSPVTVAISITGGDYSVNGGAYSSTASTVQLNDTVRVRHTSASDAATSTNTVLTIGGVSDTFTSTTAESTTITLTADEPPKMPGCSISSTPISVMTRADWWLIAGFLAWLGLIVKRRQQNHA